MKYGLVKKGLALLLTLTMVSQNFSGITVSAAETAQEQLKPVFSMDFDNLSQKVDEKLSGTLQADTGQEVNVYGTVTVAEGRNASEKAIVLDNVSGKTGYLTLANTNELNPSSLTASVWLKRISPVKDEGRVFWSKASADWMGNGWFMGWTTEESMALVTNGNNVVAKLENAQAAMPEGEWINYTSVFDDATDTITLYKNGFAIAKKQTAGAAISKNTQAAELMIGKSGYGTEGLGCIIDELCIYNQALNAEQVGKLAELKDSDYVQADKEALYVAQKVSYDFSLPMKGGKGSDITWSSDSEALKIGENGNVSITRGDKDISVNITATLTYGNAQATVQFTVIVARKGQAVDRLKKISSEEIVDISGAVGTRLKDAASVYAMSYLYEEKMDAYLNEYKNHSHSSWSWLEGEQPGKWLESMSNYKWMDKDGKIKAAITDVVNRLAQTQTKENKNATGYNQFAGYLGNATAAIRNATPLKGMDPYEMYSTLYGLMNVYEKYKEEDTALAEKALHCAIDLADYLVATIGDEDTKVLYQDGTASDMNKMEFWALPITNGVTIAGHDVHQGWEGSLLIDPMMHLAELVKDDEKKAQSYSAWVDWVIENIDKWASAWNGYGDTPYADLDKVASGEMGIDEIQHYVHAHTFQMNFLGFLKKYQETGDSSYLEKVVGAWEDITSRQRYITGTVSVGEHYEAGHNLPNTGSVGETCATNSWTMLNNNLFEFTEDAKYQQTVEDVIFNHMFATSTIDGDGYSYHRPLNGTTERFYTGPDCCSSSGMRIQSYVPYYIYLKSDSAVYINQFISSEVRINRDNGVMHLKQTTEYPSSDVVQLKVMEDSVGGMLKVRIPDWVENPTIELNGKDVDTPIAAGSYVSLSVSAGDELTITYPSEPVWVEGDNSNKGLWAIKEGPMVYCANAAFMSKEESQIAFGTDIAKVFASSVLKPENGKAVEMAETVTYDDARIFGNGYKVKMNTLLGEQNVTIVPYANIGQWYRYGDTKPANYNTTERYPYAIWMSGILTDYPQEPDPETKPVVHYDFDTTEGTTVKDISGNGKDAVLLDGAETKLNGRLGSSVNLNGTSAYIQLPEDVLYGLYDLSIAVWIKPNELGSWARIFDFGSKQSPPYPNLFATVNSGNNNLRLAYEDGENARADAGAVLKTGTWQHLAICIDGTKALLYLNGTKVAENSSFHFSPIMTTNMINNYIGKSNYASDKYFSGEIDDFRIYNRALSAKEFVALSKGEEPIKNVQTFVQPENVKTIAGIAPVLPQKVNVTYDDGTNGKENVVWEEISADKYAVEGSFEVKGTVGSQTILLMVIVEKSSLNDSEDLEPDTNVNNNTNNNTNNNNTNNNTNNDTTNNTTVVLNSETVMKDNPGLPSGTNEEARNSTFKDLTAHAAKVTKTSIQLKWKRIADAQGYIVFGNLCNNGGKKYKFEMLRIIENNTQTKYTHTKLKKGKFYKYMVQAYTIVEGKLQILATSKTIHVTTKGGKKNNVSNLKLKTPKIHLKSGERIKLKVTEVMKGKNKKSHKKLAFESGNKSIATVNAKGILKAKKKGTCDIYIYAHNGIYKKVKVQVK